MNIDLTTLKNRPLCIGNDSPCVYFLFSDGEIVYVGQTIYSVYGRIGHHYKDKEFDSFDFIEVPVEKLNEVEAELIVRIKPLYNNNIPESPAFISHAKIKKRYLITALSNGITPCFVSSNGAQYFRASEIDSYLNY